MLGFLVTVGPDHEAVLILMVALSQGGRCSCAQWSKDVLGAVMETITRWKNLLARQYFCFRRSQKVVIVVWCHQANGQFAAGSESFSHTSRAACALRYTWTRHGVGPRGGVTVFAPMRPAAVLGETFEEIYESFSSRHILPFGRKRKNCAAAAAEENPQKKVRSHKIRHRKTPRGPRTTGEVSN